jgi:hypothetical protein
MLRFLKKLPANGMIGPIHGMSTGIITAKKPMNEDFEDQVDWVCTFLIFVRS